MHYFGRFLQGLRNGMSYLNNERGNIRVTDTRTGQTTTAKTHQSLPYPESVVVGKEYVTVYNGTGGVKEVIPREHARVETDGLPGDRERLEGV